MKFQNLHNQVWKDVSFYRCEATVAYNYASTDNGAGKEGIWMFIISKLSHLVHSSSIIGINLAQWIFFKELPRGDLAILNIYAPNEVGARVQLWEELVSNLPSNCRWILCGDFNMVTDPRDNSNLKGHTTGDVESMAFLRLTSCVQASYFFNY